MLITVLSENTSRAGLPAEHGLSLLIETADRRLLFDTGQSQLFAENAAQLGIDLNTVDMAVISHGHFDHGGGLKTFLQLNDHAPVYISRYAFEPHYGAEKNYIGLDTELAGSDRLIFTGSETPITDGETQITDGETQITDSEAPIAASEAQIANGMTLYTCNDRLRSFEAGSSGLYMMQDGKIVADDFRHEQYLLIEEDGKRVLISGCSHKGILNIMDWFRPDVLVGGFHFFRMPVDERLSRYAEQLNKYATEYYTCHCTGTEQYEYLQPQMKNLNYISAGDTIRI